MRLRVNKRRCIDNCNKNYCTNNQIMENSKTITGSLPKKVVAYCRVSKCVESQSSSLKTQIESFGKTITDKKDWQIIDIYYDYGITGTCAQKRPGFLKMIDNCKKGKIDIIITKSISRFSRNTVDLLEYTRMLKDIGIGVYFEKERLFTLDSTSEMLLTVYAAFAQEESHSISENIKRGFRQRFQMGFPKYSRMYGYSLDNTDKNKWKYIDNEANIIKQIFDKYLHGEAINSIIDWLNNNGIKSTFGKNWYKTTIANILKNEKYVGDAVMQKTIVIDYLNHKSVSNKCGIAPKYVKKNHHEPIIPRDDFDIVQRSLLLKNCYSGSQQYPYYDYLKCPFCSKQMVQYMSGFSKNPTAWICSDFFNCKKHFFVDKIFRQSCGRSH